MAAASEALRPILQRGLPVALPAAGLLLMAGGLAASWLRVPLEPARTAWSLPVLITGLPVRSAFSYGVLLVVCLVAGVASLVSTHGRRTPWLAGAGIGALLLPIYFVVETVISDRALTSHLTYQQAELTAITGQLGYSIPRNQLGSVLFVPLGGAWQQVISALRPGWYLEAAGGAVVLASAWPVAVSSVRRHLLPSVAALAALAAVVLLTVGRGLAAGAVLDAANRTLQAGDYSSAVSQLSIADRLNPELTSDPKAAVVTGQALASTGDRTSSLALLYLAEVRNSLHDEIGALALMEEAARRDPSDEVVTAAARDQARRLAESRQDSGILAGVISQPWGDHVAEHYLLARILYNEGDFYTAREQLLTTESQASVDANVASSVHTYVALCDLRLGDMESARRELLTAMRLDTEYVNSLARSLAAGLYVSGNV